MAQKTGRIMAVQPAVGKQKIVPKKVRWIGKAAIFIGRVRHKDA